MALPVVVTLSLAASNATAVVNATSTAAAGSMTLVATAPIVLDNQRRLLITSLGNESANNFTITGTNQAGFPVKEVLAGPNASTTQTNLDFKTVLSVSISTATVSTVLIGTNGAGSALWNFVNWHVTPTNIEVSGVVVGSTAINYTVQYTYDDPNNLPPGVQYPQPFNHPTLVSQAASLDGPINDPVTATRILVNSGTGTVRYTMIQAGISGP